MTGAVVPVGYAALGQLTIEKLARALEEAERVDEIKDVLDRAKAIELYSRRKQGGLDAAKAAGRIVTEATLKLAKLYADEKKAAGGQNRKGERFDGSVRSPGKKAIAEAAGMQQSNLNRLKPLVGADRAQVDAAMDRIEDRGDVVTPNALMREVVGEPPVGSSTERLVVVINGRRLNGSQILSLRAAVAAQAQDSEDTALLEVRKMLEGRRRS